jgi:hypothetical protein
LLRVELLDCPCNVDDGQCEVDTVDFVFRQSKGAYGEAEKGGGGVGWTCGGA